MIILMNICVKISLNVEHNKVNTIDSLSEIYPTRFDEIFSKFEERFPSFAKQRVTLPFERAF